MHSARTVCTWHIPLASTRTSRHLGSGRSHHRRFPVRIHESADASGAEAYRADQVGIKADDLLKTSPERHDPKTNRTNVGAGHYGCLRMAVLQSAHPHRRIEGWWYGIVGGATRQSRQMSGSVEFIPPWCNWQHCGFWCHLSGFKSWRGSHTRIGP